MVAPIRSEVRFRDVLSSFYLNKGYISKLESALIEYFGVSKVLLTHSGRSALYFLLKALPQKKVYLPAYNCWAVTEAVMYAKKEIEYVDITLDDFNMDIARLREVLEPDSIVIATHQFGIPCDIDAILGLAAERNCVVLEDNAGAFGSELRGKKTGSFARAGILSFDASKTLVSGKGGAILFNDDRLYRQVRAIYDPEVRPPNLAKVLQYMVMAMGYSWATHKFVYPATYAIFNRIRGSSRSKKEINLDHHESYMLDFDERRAKLACCSLRRVGDVIARKRAIAGSFLNDEALREKLILPVLRETADPVFMKIPFLPRRVKRLSLYRTCKDRAVDLEYLIPYHYGPDPTGYFHSEQAAGQGMALPAYSALTDGDLFKIKRVILDSTESVPGVEIGHDPKNVEQRKFLFFKLLYYWMDKEAYFEDHDNIALLRTHDDLEKDEYHLRFGYKTFLVDLGKDKDEIFSRFDATGARYKIRKALKSGIEVRNAETSEDKSQFYDFYQAFAKDPKRKNKILILQKSELDRLRVLYAVSPKGDYLGGVGLLPSPDGKYLLYKYAATLHKSCENELLLWHAIQHAKDLGYKYFDMSWMTLSEDKTSDAYRLYQFKRKFGGDLVDFYTYVKFNGFLRILAKPFDLLLKRFFDDDINRFSLFLKKLRVFK